MLKKILITFVVLAVILGSIVGVRVLQIKTLINSGSDFQIPPESVSTSFVTEDEWRQTLTAIGSLHAVQGVMVSTEAAGKVTNIHFDSGETVKEGQLMVELDTSTENAQLAAAKADQQLAEINVNRARMLRESNTVAQAELDSAQAAFLEASAQVENLATVIAKKRIVAPFSGKLGIRMVDIGMFITSGDSIVSLQSTDPIYIDFSIPQNWVSQVTLGMTVEVVVDAYPEEVFSGLLTAISPAVDLTTRTIGLRGTLDNPQGKLLPGMFAQVAAVLPQEKTETVIPATSIVYASYGDSVFVVREKNGAKVAEQQFVRTGQARGDFVSITEGLQKGDQVVSTGAFKLRHGMPVVINNDLAADPELNPKPEDS